MEKAAAWSSCRLMVATSIAAFQVSGAPDGDEQASDGDAEQSYRNRHECITCCRSFGRRCCSKDGRLVSLNRVVDYNVSSIDVIHTLSDFDSTVIGPMPEADKTYEEMESDINVKFEQLAAELDVTDEYQEIGESQNEAR